MKTETHISVKCLAAELHMHRANLFKLVKNLELLTVEGRDPSTGNQKVSLLTHKDAETIRTHRNGYGVPVTPKIGCFYVVALDERLTKFGHTTNMEERMREYRRTFRNPEVIRQWECDKLYELTVIAMAVTAKDEKWAGEETFLLVSRDDTLLRLDQIFSFLPDCRRISCENWDSIQHP